MTDDNGTDVEILVAVPVSGAASLKASHHGKPDRLVMGSVGYLHDHKVSN